MDLKQIYRKYGRFVKPLLYCRNRLFGMRIQSHGTGNTVTGLDSCRAKNARIHISGSNNRIVIGDMSSLYDVFINIHGSDNLVLIGPRNFLMGAAFTIEDTGCTIQTGEHTYIYNNADISAIESTTVSIGQDCLIAGNVMIRSGDSHLILDKNTGERINPSKDVCIDDHVWIGSGSKILKGSSIGRDCVIATAAVVTGSTPKEDSVILAGIPAKVVRRDVNWAQNRK